MRELAQYTCSDRRLPIGICWLTNTAQLPVKRVELCVR